MISFIIIGRNEGWKLTKCLSGVFKTIHANNLTKFEVIYIDSKSTDNSISLAGSFKNVKIYQLTGDQNAAIARNTGAIKSDGDVLFFIDGDMEIKQDFLQLIYSEKDGLKYEFVSGQLENVFYNKAGEIVEKSNYYKFQDDKREEYIVGGIFAVKRDHWFRIGGMKNYLRRNQDIDFSLRLAQSGLLLLRLKELLAIHNTHRICDDNGIWKKLLKGDNNYRAVLMRENFLNQYQQKHFFRTNYTLYLLMICLLLVFISGNSMLILCYFGLVGLRSISKRKNLLGIPELILYYIIRDINILLSFFFFWPRKTMNIKVKAISYLENSILNDSENLVSGYGQAI